MCQNKGKRQNNTHLDSESESASMLPASKKKKGNQDDSDEEFCIQENEGDNGVSEYACCVFSNVGMMITKNHLLKTKIMNYMSERRKACDLALEIILGVMSRKVKVV